MASDLPQELVAKIVSECRDDIPSLCTCALISRGFLPWSRLQLFSSVRLTGRNVYAFRALVASSPAVATYVRHLDIPLDDVHGSAILPPESMAQLPNVTQLSAHCDPFGLRHLSPAQQRLLSETTRQLTTVDLFIDRLWTLPAWAAILNGCTALTELVIHAEAPGWGLQQDIVLEMPTAPPESTPRLHTLRISGDCRNLTPLADWLVPSGLLGALHTLAIDVLYLQPDYAAPDRRPPLVLAAAASLQVLTLHLDPPMPLTTAPEPTSLASFPLLHTLHLKDGPDAELDASLFWLCTFLQPPVLENRALFDFSASALEYISVDHGMIRYDLLAVPGPTWATLESAILAASRFRTLTFKGYQKYSIGAPDAFGHFSRTVKERLPDLEARGLLRITH
ncbi:hypothetical protein FB451DRAFT_272653 [Mycena latifolia]|nr:hypothetical protein FB451DRAFT_272653 [Mycena latifolia]